jgi:hypothetical protein
MFERWAKRIKKMSTAQVVSLAFSISVGVFVVWTFLAAVVWGTLQIVGVRFNYWQMLEAVSTAAAVAQVFGGGVVALVQLSESVDNRNLGIYNDVFEKMMSDENIEARRWIYQQLPPLSDKGMGVVDSVGQAHMKRVLNSFDHLGFLMQQDWVTADPVIHWVSPMVVKVWEKVGPYVENEIRLRNEPDYYESARELADRCKKSRARRSIDHGTVWLENAL